MSTGILLNILSPPLDEHALHAHIAAIPFAHRIGDSWHIGDRLRVQVTPSVVTVAMRYADTRPGHGTAIAAWVLERHRCTGVDLDYGGTLPDNAACTEHLLRVGTVPSDPVRVERIVASLLAGSHFERLHASREGYTLDFVRSDKAAASLQIAADAVVVTSEPDLVGAPPVLALHDRIEEPWHPLTGVAVGWGAALGLLWSEGRLDILPPTDGPSGGVLWLLADSAGELVVSSSVGAGPVVLR